MLEIQNGAITIEKVAVFPYIGEFRYCIYCDGPENPKAENRTAHHHGVS